MRLFFGINFLSRFETSSDSRFPGAVGIELLFRPARLEHVWKTGKSWKSAAGRFWTVARGWWTISDDDSKQIVEDTNQDQEFVCPSSKSKNFSLQKTDYF